MKKKIIAVLVCVMLSVSQLSALAFTDVAQNHWAKDVINKMTSLKIINGYDENTFGPEDAVKRVDALLLVSRILGASDSNQKEYVDAAYSKYFPNVNVLGYSAYEETLSYLLYRGVYSSSDLKDFVANKLGDQQLKRYEAAIILVKLMGAEETVKQNSMPLLSFDDSSSIPSEAKAYVEYCAENGLMKGMENNKFSPNTNVTRAQMATMLDTVMEKLNFTYSTGTVTDVNTLTDVIKYQDLSGNEKSVSIVGECPVKVNGDEITDVSQITKGMKINVVYSANKLYTIEFVPVVTDDVYTGIYVGNSVTSSTTKIKIKDTISSTDYREFTLADNCTITYEGNVVAISSIEKDSTIKVNVSGGKAVVIEASSSTGSATGTIAEFIYDTPSLISIKSTDGTITAYEISSSVSVKKNNVESSVSELTIGDKVNITLKYNKVSSITATSTTKTVTGKISKIVISDDPKITIENASGKIDCSVNVTSTDYITINGSPCSIYDLKLGYEATVTLESSTVKSIVVTAIDTGLGTSSSIAGTVTAVDTNFKFLTITTADGSSKQIFVNDSTYIVDSSTTKVKKLSNIAPGNTITATISTTDNSTVIAITIVIM